ncbi:hypothetical protein AWB61_12925 [Chromobacterium sp. F49]|nr:hypothetical protein Cv017_22205 [Chromobacterium subtsugae]KZE87239.1 hypothetical protein AWB61_12925 [Chromobacterium sp. F49]
MLVNKTSLLRTFSRIVPIAVELSSLSLFLEYYRKITWRRICLAALYRKCGGSIQVGFGLVSDPIVSQMYSGEGGLLSLIASPVIKLFRRRFAPAEMNLVASERIRETSIVCNLLEVSSDCSLPGETVTLLAQMVLAGSAGPDLPKLTLSDAAYAADKLWFGQFQGALRLVAATSQDWTLIVDGVRFDTCPDEETGQMRVVATRDLCAPPTADILPILKQPLQFAQVSTEALWRVNQVAPREGVTRRIQALLDWLVFIIPGDTSDETLAWVRLSCLYLARAAGTLTNAARRVPYLTYGAYRELMDSVIEVTDDITRTSQDYQNRIRERQQAERLIKAAETLNQNIIASGAMLTDYISASAQQQTELARLHASIVEVDDTAIAKTAASLQELDRLFAEQQMEVDKAVEHYQTAVANWETMEIIKFSINLCLQVFKVGFAISTPIAPAKEGVTGLGETAKKIQKLVGIIAGINKVMKLIEGGVDNIKAAQSMLEDIESGTDNLISALEWNEFRANMKLALSTGPSLPEKNALEVAFDILVQRAQAQLNAQANAKKLIGDRLLNLQRQRINQSQADRLASIASKLSQQQIDDASLCNIDLVSLSGELEAQKLQMTLTLAQTLLVQDQALQFEYLQEPLDLPALDLQALKMALVRQNVSTIKALELLSPVPQQLSEPIEYMIEGVPVSTLINGSSFRFAIPLSAREFLPFTMVRVKDVTLRIDGVAGSDGGKTVSRLLYLGNPFEDRAQNRDPLCFSSVSRKLEFLTDLKSGDVVFGGAGAAIDNISHITPFSDWEVSFPKVASNKGLTFEGATVDLYLSFNLITQLNDAPLFLQRKALPKMAMQRSLDANGAQAPVVSRNDTLAAMKGRSVTKGWDVVLNLTEAKINALFEEQYNDRKNNPQFVREIPKTENVYTDEDTGTTTRTVYSMQLGAPRIEFMNNNSQYAKVFMEVTGGSYEFGVLNDGTYIPISAIKDSDMKGKTLTAYAELGKIEGSVDNSRNQVVVNLSKGTFSTNLFKITTTNPMFNGFIAEYFAELDTNYELGALSMDKYSVIDALKPRKFQFNVLRTNAEKDLLQLFITTDGTQKSTLSLDVEEPVPDGDDCSMIVSSRIIFDKVLPASLRDGGSYLTLEGVDPGNNHTTWSGRFTSGTLQATFTSSNPNIRISSSSNLVPVDFTGMIIGCDDGANLKINYAKTESRSFQYYKEHCSPTPGDPLNPSCIHSWDNHQLDVTVSLSSDLPISFGGSGQNQQIDINASSAIVKVGGNLSPAGSCETNDRELQSNFLDQLSNQLPPYIRSNLGVNFQGISLFALKNLLFPANNIITFNGAYTPGDMIVFGTIASKLN